MLYYQHNANFPQAGGNLQETKNRICPQAGGELFNIPWGHHKCIIDKCFDKPAKAYF